jgi:hypothetical protein
MVRYIYIKGFLILQRLRGKHFPHPSLNIDIILEITINLPQLFSDFHSDKISSFLSSWEVEKHMQFATENSGNSWENVIFADIATFR